MHGRGRILWRLISICPVAGSRRDLKIRMVRQAQCDGMQSRVRRLRMKRQHVPIRQMITDGLQAALQALCVGELEIFAAGEVRHGLGDIAMQSIA